MLEENFSSFYHIIIPISIAIVANIIIYIFDINKKDSERNSEKNSEKENTNSTEDLSKNEFYKKYIPPGYIIGIIWIIIFGLLGYAHYLLFVKHNGRITFSSLSIIFIIIFCLLYPFITGLKVKSGLLLNLISLILAFTLGIIIILESKFIFLFILPLILWTSFINIIDTLQCSIS